MIRFLKSECGSSPIVGFVLLFPLLAIIVYGIIWYSQMANVQNVVEEAARAGARWLATHPGDIEGARQRAAEVIMGSFTVKKDIDNPYMADKLVGRLTKKDGSYFIGDTMVKPVSENARQDMEELLNKTVVIDGYWGEANVFNVKTATTDPPEMQIVEQQDKKQNEKQVVNQTRHLGPFPAAVLGKYAQVPWGTWWVPPTRDPERHVYERRSIDFTGEGGRTAYWNPSFSAPSGTVIREVSFRTAAARDDFFTTQRVEGYKNGRWHVIKDYHRIHGTHQGHVSDTINLEGKGYTRIRFNFVMRDRARSAQGSPSGSFIRITYERPLIGWPDPEAQWIWGQSGAHWFALSGQEVMLVSPTWWTQDYAKYRLYVAANDAFNIKIDDTVVLQGGYREMKTWDWKPGKKRPVQLTVNARNNLYSAGFLFSMYHTGWHWPTTYQPQLVAGGLARYPGWTVPHAQWVVVTAKDRHGRAVPVHIGTEQVPLIREPERHVYERRRIDFTGEGGRTAYWNPSFSAPSGTVIREVSFRTAAARDDFFTTQRVEGYKNGRWHVIKDYHRIHGTHQGHVSDTINLEGKGYTRIRFNFVMRDRARSAQGSPSGSFIRITYERPSIVDWVATGKGTLRFYAYPNTTYFVYVGPLQSIQQCSVTVDFKGEVVLRSDGSWQYKPVDGVRYGAVTLPRKVSSDAEFTVELTVTNISHAWWYAERPPWWTPQSWGENWAGTNSWQTQFTYHWYDSNGELVVKDGLRTELPRNIRPNETVNLDMKIKAPSQPGRYRLVIDGAQGQNIWFGPLGAHWPTIEAWIEVVDIPYSVSYNPVQVPKYMEAGKTYKLQVTVTNTGTLTWAPGNKIGLSYRWYDKYKDSVITWDSTRVYIQHPVSPGSEYTFSLPVTAPSNPGSYILELDMVRGETWFSQKGCPVVNASIEVPRGQVLKGMLAYDGMSYWIGNILIRSVGPDLSRFAGQGVILWGNYIGEIRFYWITSIKEYFPDERTAVVTFYPDKDVLSNDPLRGDPKAPPGDPVGLRRDDGYAYTRVTFHYPIPIREFWDWASDKGLWRDAEAPSWSITGEAFFRSGEGGE